MDIDIIKISISDVEKLRKLSIDTFCGAFSDDNSKEDLENFINTAYSLEKLSNEINNSSSEFYFALAEGKEVGYLKLNFKNAQTEFHEESGMEIERVYALQEFLGKKIGQALFDKAFEIAQNRNMKYIWLGVWEKNPRGIKFYKKYGFTEFSTHIFNIGNDPQTDILMKLELR